MLILEEAFLNNTVLVFYDHHSYGWLSADHVIAVTERRLYKRSGRSHTVSSRIGLLTTVLKF